MKGSFSLGSIAGIKISIHWTFSLLILYIIYSNLRAGQDALQIAWSVFFILSIFVTVFLHELGHALAAKRFKIITKDITLLPIGGIARLERIPEKPTEELIVAIAGPLVNMGIALAVYFFVTFPDPEQLAGQLTATVNSQNFLLHFFIVNIWLAFFNLIPAFPMDGGRVLRAVLTYFMPRHRSTTIAARIGQLLAIGFILLGFSSNPFLIFIGLFIMLGAQTEMELVTTNYLLQGSQIGQITMHQFESLQTRDTVQTAVDILLNGTSKNFLVMENGQPAGSLSRNDIIEALSKGSADQPVSAIMNRNLIYLDAGTPVEHVFAQMNEGRHELAVIRQQGQFAGVIDTENILEFVLVRGALQKK